MNIAVPPLYLYIMPTIHYTSRKFLKRHGVHPPRTTRPSATNPFLSTLLRQSSSSLESSSSSTAPAVEFTKELAVVSAKPTAVDGTDMNVYEQSMRTQDDDEGYAMHAYFAFAFLYYLHCLYLVYF